MKSKAAGRLEDYDFDGDDEEVPPEVKRQRLSENISEDGVKIGMFVICFKQEIYFGLTLFQIALQFFSLFDLTDTGSLLFQKPKFQTVASIFLLPRKISRSTIIDGPRMKRKKNLITT